MTETEREEIEDLLDLMNGHEWEGEWKMAEGSQDEDASKPDPSHNPILSEGSVDVPPPWPQHLRVLQNSFGHSKFRPNQWRIIRSIIVDKQDNCVIMATGHGKSLTYQYPAVFCEGISVVVSPLISLMEDQVFSLKMHNIEACLLGSAQTSKVSSKHAIFSGKVRVVYVTPEYLNGDCGFDLILEMSKQLNVVLVAVDEAHCVSQWGHDFRGSYRTLGKLRDALPNVPFLAVTATATPDVRRDICESLHLKSPNVICTSFDRPNLYFSVGLRTENVYQDLKKLMVRDGSKPYQFDGPTIIYCLTQKTAESVSENLSSKGIVCDVYHAGRGLKDRKNVHERFLKDEIQVVVATVAFGMGIDKPDVRCIIHWGAPKDMESYYQEVGRAGRDGLPAKCYVFYAPKDFLIHRFFLKSLSGNFLKHREEMGKCMERYLDSTACRRMTLLLHFEGKNLPPKSDLTGNCCDNCSSMLKKQSYLGPSRETALDFSGTYDFTEDGVLYMKSVEYCEGRNGSTIIHLILRGSESSKLTSRHSKSPVFGKGKHKSEEWWKGLNRLLLREGYIESKGLPLQNFKKGSFPISVTDLTDKGRKFLLGYERKNEECFIRVPPNPQLLLLINRKFCKPVPVEKATSSTQPACLKLPSSQVLSEAEEKQALLYKSLLRFRKELSEKMGCAPFHLASNSALSQMAKLRPSKADLLSEVDGMTTAQIERDGMLWIDHILQFCQQQNLVTTDEPSPDINDSLLESLPSTIQETYVKFQIHKVSLERISEERKLKVSTLTSHLSNALIKGLPVDLPRAGLQPETESIILKAIRSPPVNSDLSKLAPIKQNCPPSISFEQIRLMVSYLTVKHKLQRTTTSEQEASTSTPSTSSSGPDVKDGSSGFVSCLKAVKAQPSLTTFIKKEPLTLRTDTSVIVTESNKANDESDSKLKDDKDGDIKGDITFGIDWEDDMLEEQEIKVERSVSAEGLATVKEEDTSVQRSLSADSQGSPCSCNVVKRKLPEWLTKPTAQQEAKKKMKQNSLFKC